VQRHLLDFVKGRGLELSDFLRRLDLESSSGSMQQAVASELGVSIDHGGDNSSSSSSSRSRSRSGSSSSSSCRSRSSSGGGVIAKVSFVVLQFLCYSVVFTAAINGGRE